MIISESYSQLHIKTHSIAVVLDTSESAQGHWEEIISLAISLENTLPADTNKKLYFLSNPRNYNFNDLTFESKNWREENRLRGSFITPVVNNLDRGIGRIVVIGSGPIYDIEDWMETDFAGKFIFVKTGESLTGNHNVGIEIEPSELLSHLHDPIQSVEISGKEFMPFYWDNHEYKLVLGDEILLRGGRNLKDYSISFAYYGKKANAWVKRTGSEAQITPIDSEMKPQEEWEALSDIETKIFRQACNGCPFTCLHCGEKHPADILRCLKLSPNSIFGKPVYPSLENKEGFFVFREAGKIVYRYHPVNVIKVGEAQVAIIAGKKVKLYKFEQGKWIEKKELNPYYPFKEKQYLVAI